MTGRREKGKCLLIAVTIFGGVLIKNVNLDI
jgi:hypothetical protein